MNFKKTLVSALSVSALALAVSGVASAKEAQISPSNTVKSVTTVSGPIKVQDYSIDLAVGKTASVANPVAETYSSDASGIAKVDKYGVVTGVSKGTAHITLFKSDRSILGVVTVNVK
ncbi:Ig-like domain-containing protein [Bacillus stercoris]|uniref:Ig-like domain-containing protein n=1 Tax=Bacillus stercoris TaxID=2054641 RepID=UPI002DBC2457|nr:Ig-like domain-containing protein [Bacillus stercoris]MEC3614253.1 Ig-like domain-containing protein [Bacillus stercoris]